MTTNDEFQSLAAQLVHTLVLARAALYTSHDAKAVLPGHEAVQLNHAHEIAAIDQALQAMGFGQLKDVAGSRLQ